MNLTDDHDGLRKMMREFAQAMNAPKADMVDIARRRIAFSQLFRQHMEREDAFVRTLGNSGQTSDVVRMHGNAIRDLFLQYSAHIKAWTPDRILNDWAGYRTAVLGLQRQLFDRMVWEEKTLHPLGAHANNNGISAAPSNLARRQTH